MVTEVIYAFGYGDLVMKNRYRVFRRNGATYYLRDKKMGGAESLETTDKVAKNEVVRQSHSRRSWR